MPTGSFYDMSQRHSNSAISAYSSQIPKRETSVSAPQKTMGGGLMAGVGGALAGAQVGGMMAAPMAGAAIGGGAMVLSYLLS